MIPQIEPFSFNPNGMSGGASVRMLCSVIAGDLPVNITWFKDDVVILTGGDHRTQRLDETTVILSLSRLSLSDSGNYTCQAVNKAGRAHNSSLLLVKGTFFPWSEAPFLIPFSFLSLSFTCLIPFNFGSEKSKEVLKLLFLLMICFMFMT